LTVAATTAATALIANVGSTDAIVTFTVAGTSLTTGAGVIVIKYMVRNSDGSANPTAQQA
jgi:4-hydroxybenzoate polyprenyltransferase